MADFNIQGRWTLPPQNYEVNIVMTGRPAFNIVSLTAELKNYWKGGYGEVYESGKVWAIVTDPSPDTRIEGVVSSDMRTIHWNNGYVWRKLQ